jgi:predicted CoA-substrate-specific enzyme activase
MDFYSEKTPVRQREYFEKKFAEIQAQYSPCAIVSCGYGKDNVAAVKKVNELTALAKGGAYLFPDYQVILDIGGQDTKIIKQSDGKLVSFFVNDKCAAGSGIFLNNTLNLLEKKYEDVVAVGKCPLGKNEIELSSVCAVFAQSEIVSLLADNVPEDLIIRACLRQILVQAKGLLEKVECDKLLLSGGLSSVKGITEAASEIYGMDVACGGRYLSAVGCAMIGV